MGGVAGDLIANLLALTFYGEKRIKDAGTDLIPQTLASNDGDFIADTLVRLEVQGQFWVVAFDYDFGRLLYGLGANATLLFAETSALVGFQKIGIGTTSLQICIPSLE